MTKSSLFLQTFWKRYWHSVLNAVFQFKFTSAQRKRAFRGFWGGVLAFTAILATFDKLGYRKGPAIRSGRSWQELLDDLPYIVVVALIISIFFYFGELRAIKKDNQKGHESKH